MKRVLLIFGDPTHGKSHLAKTLRKEHGFHHVSVDDAYVEFIRSKCQDVYFPKLDVFIAQHFENILHPPSYTLHHLDRDYIAEWHAHLVDLVADMSERHDSLAVEGYLLRYCLDDLAARMAPTAHVFVIEAIGRTYHLRRSPLSIEDIASLGLEEGP